MKQLMKPRGWEPLDVAGPWTPTTTPPILPVIRIRPESTYPSSGTVSYRKSQPRTGHTVSYVAGPTHHRLIASTGTRRPRRDSHCHSAPFWILPEAEPLGHNSLRSGHSPRSCSPHIRSSTAQHGNFHTGAAVLMANRLTPLAIPNPSEFVTIWHSFALSRVQQHSMTLRGTLPWWLRGGRYSNQDGVQSACNPRGTPRGTPRYHLRENPR